MNFDYDSEQNDLREAVRGLLARAYADSEQRRRCEDQEQQERTAQLLMQDAEPRYRLLRVELIGPVAEKTGVGVRGGQPARA